MTDQYVPALRQRFLEDMQIKGLQPKTQTLYLRGMRGFWGVLQILQRWRNYGRFSWI